MNLLKILDKENPPKELFLFREFRKILDRIFARKTRFDDHNNIPQFTNAHTNDLVRILIEVSNKKPNIS